jgi:hypothetical protein
MELSQKTKTNAAIAYFFLGPVFLLASKNPNFSDPFVRSHAKAASKAIAFYLSAFFAYAAFVSDYLSFPVPLFPVTADRIVSVTILALMFATLGRGMIRAHTGKLPAKTFETPLFS